MANSYWRYDGAWKSILIPTPTPAEKNAGIQRGLAPNSQRLKHELQEREKQYQAMNEQTSRSAGPKTASSASATFKTARIRRLRRRRHRCVSLACESL